MRRACALLVLLPALVAPPAAVGQGDNPFGPLPQPAPPAPEQPEPQPRKRDVNDDGLGGRSFWLIIGTTGAIFLAVTFFIVRDMRRSTRSGRRRTRRRGPGRPARKAADTLAAADSRHVPGSRRARAKAQQRAKTKAARKQRRRSRSR